MTVNVVRRTRRRTPEPRPDPIVTPKESLAIGEINQTVFDCPKCARPIAIGVRRCPGCHTRLVLRVPLATAAVFASVGLAFGIAFGGALGFSASLGRTAAATTVPGIAVPPSAATVPGGGGTTPTASPTSVPSSGAGPADIPPMSRSALSQAIGVNGRLAAGAATLRAALDGRQFDASTVAQTLRSLSADSVFGQQLAGRLTDWPGSASLGRDLETLYDSVHQTSTEWLVSSVRDEAAYRAAAAAMLDVLKGLTALDAEANALAGRVGLVVAPSAAP
jgi:hypothetical protein